MTQDALSSTIDLPQRRDTDEQTRSMQAWLQLHLDNYVELNLLKLVPEKVDDSWIGDGSSLLCLAHRFCPSAIPDLLETLQDESTDKISIATHIFQKELNVSIPTASLHDKDTVTAYLSTLKQAMDQLATTEQTLKMTQINMVSERQWIQVTRRTRENTVEDDEFERRATHVLNKIIQLRNQLNDMTLLTSMAAAGTTARPSNNEENNGNNKNEVSSLQVNKDTMGDENNSDNLAANVQQFEATLEAFRQGELADIHAYIREMSDDARTSVYTRIQAIDAAHTALEAQLQEDFRAIRLGVQFAQLTMPIRNELEFIQAKMLKTTTTEEGIRDLEDRTRRVKDMIIDIEEKHSRILVPTNDIDISGSIDNDVGQQRSYQVHFDSLKQKHRLVSSWVDEVRVWFIEAERIRRWIEERIDTIESEPLKDAIQTEELSEYTIAMVDVLNTKHETMEKEVEKLNKEDMTRLRSHVKTLTGSEKQNDKDLSPADTTTIEITFTTLMTLDKLMHLLRRRSYDLQMLTLRLFWEKEHDKAYRWVTETNGEVDGLLQQARWQQDEEKGIDRTEAETLKNMTVHLLLDIEQRASEFDQGQFTTAVNMYQEMDDTSKVELPPHLESRQVDLEEAFEVLTKRLGYVRQVVEQRLTVVDFVYRADELMGSGEQLREEITLAEQQVTDADSDRDFTEQIRYFQEQAVQLVTSVAARIRYPEHAYPTTEMPENNKVNDTVRAAMSARKSVLILLGEGLDHKLQSFKRVLELQKSATHIDNDIHQLEDTVEKQIKLVQETKVDIFVAKCTLDQQQLEQLGKERDDQLAKAGTLKHTDWKILKDYLDSLKQDVDLAGAVAVQTDVLYDSMERLYKRIGELEALLSSYTADLDALKKRMEWEAQYELAMRSILSTLHGVWDIIRQMQWQPDVDDLLTKEKLTNIFTLLRLKVDEFEKQQHIQTSKSLFDTMMVDLSKLLLDDNASNNTLPGHFQQRQDTLQQSVQDLKDSIDFANRVHDQHVALIHFMDHATTTHQRGQQLTDALENAIKHIMVDKEPHHFTSDIQQFEQTLQNWWANYGASIPYPVCSTNARASHSSTTDDHAANKDIEGVVKSQHVELEELGVQLESLVDKYNTAFNLKQEVVETCDKVKQQQCEVEDVLTSIASDRQDLSIDSMDLLTLPDTNVLKAANQTIQQKVEEAVATLEDLRGRYKKLDHSIHDSNCHPEVSTVVITDALETLASRIEKLKSVSAIHTQELDVSSVRVGWEQHCQNATKEAEGIQVQLRQLVDRKNTLTPGHADQHELTDLKTQAELIQQNVSKLSNDTLAPAQASYDCMVSAYSSASIDIPHGVIERQSDMKGLFSRLSDTAEQTKRELDYLIQRSSWEYNVNNATESCTQQEQKVEDFIQHHARWSMDDNSTSANDIWKELEELEGHVTRITDTMVTLARECQELLDQQMEETQDTLIRRKNAVESTAQRLQSHLAFAKQVLDQRDTFNAYLEETQQLESLCESIKNDIERGTAGQDQVDTYAKRVETFCLDDCSLPYPVRDYKQHDPRCRSLDENANIVVAEAFDAHHSRLKQLPDILISALKSKQLQTERLAAGDAYMMEAQTVEAWINTKLASLDRALGDDDDEDKPAMVNIGIQKRRKADKRRSAIATVDATFAAMQTYNNAYNSLKLQARKLDDNNQVHERQDQIDQLWQKLSSGTGLETKEKLKEQLRIAEFKQSVSEFEDQCAQLQDQIDTADLSTLSDDQVAEWREQAQALKNQYLEKLGTSHRQVDEKMQYDQVVSEQQNLVDALQNLDKRLHKHRLVTDYDKRTNDLTTFMHNMTDDLDEMRDKYGFIVGDIADDEDNTQAFIDAYDDAHQQLQEHLEQLEVQRSFFRSLQIQDAVTDDIRARQTQFEEDYQKLESAVENAKMAKEQLFQWRDLHSKLRLIQESAVVDMDDEEGIEQGKDKLTTLESKLALAMTMADRLVNNEDSQQLVNKEKFIQHHEAVANKLRETKASLDIKEQEVRERESLEACRTATTIINDRCRREIAAIKSRIRSAGDRCAELFEDIHSIEKHYRRASIGSASSLIGVYDELSDKLNNVEASVTNDAERLLVAEARDSLRSLNNAITSEQRWNDMVRRALGHAKTAENITSWVGNCKNAIEDISNNMDMTSDKDMEAEMRDIQHRINDFSTIIDSFKGMTQGIIQVNSTGNNEDELPAAIESLKTHVIRPCAEQIDAEWQGLQDQMASLEDCIAKASKGVAVVRQMKRILKVCSDTRGRLELLESDPSRVTLSSAHKQHHRPLSGVLREQDVLAIEQALNTIETEGQDQAKRELEKLDTMIADFGDADGAFVQQRSEMEAALSNMTTALNDKRQNLVKALEVGKCLMITDDIDVLVDALEDAVEKAKTVTLINKGSPATNKADMQGKYIELDARYKYYERKITQSLEAAKLATDDISDQKDREMIVEHIGELRKRWEDVDQRAKQQRSELSKALAAGQQLNRGRKSSLPTRKASNFLRERERSPSRLPAPPTGHHGNTSSPLLSAASRLMPSTSLPRPTPRHTTTSTSKLTPPSVRRPPPPSKSSGSPKKPPAPPANSYVADPKNDLDMEIGRIVNETPYRVKVKMVPGEVGRYWFGDANPKLAYCRVLKSKMVMVRVGGGWMELSQFLRGHALLEGDFIPKTVEPDHPVLPVQEGFIETRRRQPHIRSRSRSPSSSSSLAAAYKNKNNTNNTNNSINNSNSNSLLPLPPSASISGSRSTPQNSLSSQTGYMDGDRYIAVDRFGNQLEVKMRKMTESTSGNTRMKSRQ